MSIAIFTVLAFVLIGLGALLAAADAAWNYAPRHEIERSDTSGATALHQLRKNLPVALIAMNFWRIVAEMGAALAAALVLWKLIPLPWLAAVVIIVVLGLFGILLVGISPRSIGRAHPMSVIRASAPLARVLVWLVAPLASRLERWGTHRAQDGEHEGSPSVTEAEFREIIERASDEDVLEDSAAELIRSVVDIGDTRVREVMVPRTDMVSIPADRTVRQALSLLLRSGFSRIPVFADNTDNILGMLYLKDMAKAQLQGAENEPAAAFMREVQFVPESMNVRDLLAQMQLHSRHIAIVVDEYGGTAGLVTLEDLIEEIVGEITDEYDQRPVQDYLQNEDGSYLVSARMPVDDFARLMDISVEDDGVDTVGGLLAKELGMVPIVGSQVSIDGLQLRAQETEGRRKRVAQLKVWREENSPEMKEKEG